MLKKRKKQKYQEGEGWRRLSTNIAEKILLRSAESFKRGKFWERKEGWFRKD